MEIQGKVTHLLEEQKGEGRNGQWRKREYIIETQDQYPKKICFNLWGDKIDQFPMKVNDTVKVFFDIESREFNGKWYTDVRAWKVESMVAQNNSGTNEFSNESDIDLSAPEFNPPLPEEDDLPF